MRTVGFMLVLTSIFYSQFMYVLSPRVKSLAPSINTTNRLNENSKSNLDIADENNHSKVKMWYVGQDMALIQLQDIQ